MCYIICFFYMYTMLYMYIHYMYTYIYIWYKDVYLIIFWWKCTAFALPFETCSPLHAQLPHLTISSWNSATKTPSPSACADKPETWQEVGDWPMDGSERERERADKFQWTILWNVNSGKVIFLINIHVSEMVFKQWYSTDLLLLASSTASIIWTIMSIICTIHIA